MPKSGTCAGFVNHGCARLGMGIHNTIGRVFLSLSSKPRFFFFFFFLFGSTRSRIDANLDSTYILFTITINIYIHVIDPDALPSLLNPRVPTGWDKFMYRNNQNGIFLRLIPGLRRSPASPIAYFFLFIFFFTMCAQEATLYSTDTCNFRGQDPCLYACEEREGKSIAF